MDNNSILNHIKNILILPGFVLGVVPYLLILYLNPFQIANDHIALKITGGVFLAIGVLLLLRTIYLFGTVGKGTLAPWNPTQRLVIRGPYKYVRNPMITAVLSILIGESLYLNSISILVWAMVFFIINSVYFEFVEEPKLERKFGESYLKYKDNVSRWIPKLKPYQK